MKTVDVFFLLRILRYVSRNSMQIKIKFGESLGFNHIMVKKLAKSPSFDQTLVKNIEVLVKKKTKYITVLCPISPAFLDILSSKNGFSPQSILLYLYTDFQKIGKNQT